MHKYKEGYGFNITPKGDKYKKLKYANGVKKEMKAPRKAEGKI